MKLVRVFFMCDGEFDRDTKKLTVQGKNFICQTRNNRFIHAHLNLCSPLKRAVETALYTAEDPPNEGYSNSHEIYITNLVAEIGESNNHSLKELKGIKKIDCRGCVSCDAKMKSCYSKCCCSTDSDSKRIPLFGELKFSKMLNFNKYYSDACDDVNSRISILFKLIVEFALSSKESIIEVRIYTHKNFISKIFNGKQVNNYEYLMMEIHINTSTGVVNVRK